ncbi:ABC transporter ATP-binding protein [Tardiphaga robiniae]|nr:ABC transporter ATP-binding protein [Tardiphaga robiniae]
MIAPQPSHRLLEIRNLSRAFGGVKAVNDVSFVVTAGRIHALIGPNGAGKTTLFNLVAGVVRPSAGQVLLDERDVTDLPTAERAQAGLQRTFQNLQTFSELTALESVMVGAHLRSEPSFLKALFNTPAIRQANAEARDRAEMLLQRVGLDTFRDSRSDAMPYGALKRLDIARALAAEPKLLLMDEPAAGLNPAETATMRDLIADIALQGVTVLLVEHDMKLVMSIAETIVVLDQGQKLAEGTPDEIRRSPEVIRAYLGGGIRRRRS